MTRETAVRCCLAAFAPALLALLAPGFAYAGDMLGIYDASNNWAASLTSVGVPAAICGIAVAGAGIITHSWSMAVGTGVATAVGGAVITNAYTGAPALFGGAGGGGDLSGYLPEAAAGGLLQLLQGLVG
jgi:hypothetical protein